MLLRLNILFFIIWFLTFNTSCFSQRTSEWEVLQSPTSDLLRKLYFVDANNGWATGLSGTIIHTTDAGSSWTLQNSNETSPIVDVFFINKNLGWAITYRDTPPFGTTILKTTNSGQTWVSENYPFPQKFMSCIYFTDKLTGWIGGNGIAKTTDGGVTWQECLIDSGGYSNYPVYDLNFYNKDFGYACGGRVDVAGVIWKTTNGGNNWSSIGLSPDQIFDVFIFDSLNAITLSGDPELLFNVARLITSDAGTTWQNEELPFFGISFAIDFLDDKEGWSASGYKFLSTWNGGQTWNEELTPGSTIIYDLQFVDKYTGFACGENGALLKFTSFKKPLVDKPIFEMLQNHPNPFSQKTTFNVTCITPNFDVPALAQIKLFDILGNEILTLVDQDFNWGIYEFTFDPSLSSKNISSGIYILTLVSGEIMHSQKIVYIK